MITLTCKNGSFLWYQNVFLENTQIAFMDTLEGRIVKEKTFYRNKIMNPPAMIVELKSQDLGVGLTIDNEHYYFSTNIRVLRNEEESLFEAAKYGFITDKGIDTVFFKPRITEAIRSSFKNGTTDHTVEKNKQLLEDINKLIQSSSESKCLEMTFLDVYKQTY